MGEEQKVTAATRAQQQLFTTKLMQWHEEENTRELLWKNIRDPYYIWLSEIILQQTRTEQGKPYYEKFVANWPNIKSLAAAKDDDVFRQWQGLGYYNRCRNLLHTARHIAKELAGYFPKDYEGLLALKGIGTYTAAAIASFAFGLPHAVVDGNVYRVLARYFGIETPYDSTQGKAEFAALAQQLLDKGQPAAYNQAIMDLGATVCKPKLPDCMKCPLQERCIARRQDLINLLPVKSKKQKVTHRYLHYILFQEDGKVWLRKRTGKDVWQNLHDFYLIETATGDREEVLNNDNFQSLGLPLGTLPVASKVIQHQLTHQRLHLFIYPVFIEKEILDLPEDGEWVAYGKLNELAFPKPLVGVV